MDTAADLGRVVSLLQLSDSAFPTGRYAHSYGLEAFAQHGWLGVPSPPSVLCRLLSDTVEFGVAPSDGVALACAHRAVEANGEIDLVSVAKADLRLTAVKVPTEMREASRRTGRALLRVAKALIGSGLSDYEQLVDGGRTPGNHAVLLGLVSACLGVPLTDAVAGELYSFSASWVAAATRLGLTDHLTAQALLHRTSPIAAACAITAATRKVDDISSCTPFVDLMSMRHESAEVRLFAS
jgi:urease accessory protein